MASIITNRVSLSKSGSFTKATAVFLFILLVVKCLSAAPARARRQQEDNWETNVTKQIYWGMEIFTQLERDLGASVDAVKYQAEEESLNVLCTMYDLYKDSTFFLSTVSPDDPLHANYSSTQYVAYRAMNSSCQWTNQTNSSLIPDGCTLASIAKTCYSLHFNRMILLKNKVLPEGVTVPLQDFSIWRRVNELSRSITDVLNDVTTSS